MPFLRTKSTASSHKFVIFQLLKILIILGGFFLIYCSRTQELDPVWYELKINKEAMIYLLILLPFLYLHYYMIHSIVFNKYKSNKNFSTKHILQTQLTVLACTTPLTSIILASYLVLSLSVVQRWIIFAFSLFLAMFQARRGISTAEYLINKQSIQPASTNFNDPVENTGA